MVDDIRRGSPGSGRPNLPRTSTRLLHRVGSPRRLQQSPAGGAARASSAPRSREGAVAEAQPRCRATLGPSSSSRRPPARPEATREQRASADLGCPGPSPSDRSTSSCRRPDACGCAPWLHRARRRGAAARYLQAPRRRPLRIARVAGSRRRMSSPCRISSTSRGDDGAGGVDVSDATSRSQTSSVCRACPRRGPARARSPVEVEPGPNHVDHELEPASSAR